MSQLSVSTLVLFLLLAEFKAEQKFIKKFAFQSVTRVFVYKSNI